MRKETRYYWNGSRMVPSATSVMPSPWLADWAANCAVDYIIKCKETDDYNHVHKEDFADARKHFHRESMEAADYGTYIHTLCEYSLTNEVQVVPPHEMTSNFMAGFWVWCYKHNVKPIAMEHEVTTEWYGGRLDLVCEMDSFWMTKAWCKKFGVEWYKGIEKQRVIVLVDFKTGKSCYYDTWKYQTAGYRQAYNSQIHRDAIVFVADEVTRRIENPTLEKATGYYGYTKKHETQHHGVLKFNKETGKVNFKTFDVYEATRIVPDCPRLSDGSLRKEKYIRTYEMDKESFNTYVRQWWADNQGIEI